MSQVHQGANAMSLLEILLLYLSEDCVSVETYQTETLQVGPGLAQVIPLADLASDADTIFESWLWGRLPESFDSCPPLVR